jgi:serine/threonine protein kinase/tetratricopeptide (TPR) repeat protein
MAHEDRTEPERIGRYEQLELVGSGGMGRVYSAYDPVLDRRVAVKVVRARAAGWMDVETARRRLLREAQALASLAHPNVVPVFDVGTFASSARPAEPAPHAEATDEARTRSLSEPAEPPTIRMTDVEPVPSASPSMQARVADEDVYVAMEFVEGATLTRWLDVPRPWRQVLDAVLDAARGLAAAHAEGIVHGDIKPANILVADDGRIMVADFGLARPSSEAVHSGSVSGRWIADGLDTQSQVLGTPPFMAPEQHRGIVDTAADQFALCVTMWLALYGDHPFSVTAGEPQANIVGRIRAGQAPGAIPSSTEVPRRIGRVLQRGLAADPQARWRSVDALVRALQQASGGRGWRWAAGLSAVAAAVAAFVLGRPSGPPSCAPPADALAHTWDDGRRQELRALLPVVAPQWRTDVLSRVEARLDEWRERWEAQWATTCAATDPDSAMHAGAVAQRQCLQARRGDVVALLDVLSTAEDEVWALAPRAAGDLESPETCAQATGRTDEVVEAGVEQGVVGLVARARAEHAAGHHARALDLAEQALQQAPSGASTGARLQAMLVAGSALSDLARLDEAVARLETVVWEASAGGYDDISINAMLTLLFIEGVDRGHYADALAWAARLERLLETVPSARVAAGLYLNVGLTLQAKGDLPAAERSMLRAWAMTVDEPPDRRATVASALGNVARDLGHRAQATEYLTEALMLREQAFGPEHPDVATALNNLGLQRLADGDGDAARADFQRALQIGETALGPEHPRLALFLNNLANVAYGRGELDEALPLYQRTADILTEHFGEDHPSTLTTRGNLGLVLRGKGEPERALVVAQDVLDRSTQVLPAGHASLGMAHNNLAGVLWDLKRLDEAQSHYEQALEIRRAALGPEHPLVATTLDNLARLAIERGDPATGLELSTQAFWIWHSALDPAHVKVAIGLTTMGRALLARGEVEAARFELGHALALLEAATDADPADIEAARTALTEARRTRVPRAKGPAGDPAPP